MLYNEKIIKVQKFLTGEMSSAEKPLFDAWLKENKENELLFDQLSEIWNNSKNYTPLQFDANVAFNKHLDLLNEDKTQVKSIFSKNWIKIAAIFLVLVASVLVFTLSNDTLEYNTQDSPKYVVLPDGSQVWMASHSTISVNKNIDKERKVSIKGKAFFDVFKNQDAPFIISTDKMTVEVVGTEFLVDEPQNAIHVKNGNVLVKDNKNNTASLFKNQAIHLDNGILTEILSEDYDAMSSGLNEDLTFDNAPLDKVLQDISAKFDIKFINASTTTTANCRFTSGALKENTLDQILTTLELTYELEYSKLEDQSISLSKILCK